MQEILKANLSLKAKGLFLLLSANYSALQGNFTHQKACELLNCRLGEFKSALRELRSAEFVELKRKSIVKGKKGVRGGVSSELIFKKDIAILSFTPDPRFDMPL